MKPIFKHIFWNLSRNEIDMINVLMSIIERNNTFNNIDFSNNFSYVIDTNMHELSALLDFKKLDIQEVLRILESIVKNPATLVFKNNSNKFMNKVNFIHQINVSSTNGDVDKRLSLVINSSIIQILRDEPTLFELFYRFEKFEIKSKYSRIFYEYFYKMKEDTKHFSITELIEMIDFNLENTEMNWTRLNNNVIKRVQKEINYKSDLQINCTKLKKIEIENDKEILFKTKITPLDYQIGYVFHEKDLMERKIDYAIEREIMYKFEQVKRLKTHEIIHNPQAYLYTMRIETNKKRSEFEARVSLQEWLNNIKYTNKEHQGLVILSNYSGIHKYVTVNNDFRLYDIISSEVLSSTARDTKIKITEFMKKGEYDIIETDEYMKNCSISYSIG